MGSLTLTTVSDLPQTLPAIADNFGTGVLVLGVGESRKLTGVGFDQNLVAGFGERLDAGGSDANTRFVVLNLFGNADDHGRLLRPASVARLSEGGVARLESCAPDSFRNPGEGLIRRSGYTGLPVGHIVRRIGVSMCAKFVLKDRL